MGRQVCAHGLPWCGLIIAVLGMCIQAGKTNWYIANIPWIMTLMQCLYSEPCEVGLSNVTWPHCTGNGVICSSLIQLQSPFSWSFMLVGVQYFWIWLVPSSKAFQPLHSPRWLNLRLDRHHGSMWLSNEDSVHGTSGILSNWIVWILEVLWVAMRRCTNTRVIGCGN